MNLIIVCLTLLKINGCYRYLSFIGFDILIVLTKRVIVFQLDNYYVAAGMNSVGIQSAGGVGKLMSEWIVDGEPSRNCWSLDIRRFVDLHNNKKFLRDRVKESLGKYSLLLKLLT